MFNADGSESEMCGNGVRCVAKYVYDHGIARKPRVTIETGRGVLTLDLEVENDKVSRVRVDMGEPILQGGGHPDDAARATRRSNVAARRSPGIDLDGHGRLDGQPARGRLRRRRRRRSRSRRSAPVAGASPGVPAAGERPLRPGALARAKSRCGPGSAAAGITLACGTGACAVCVAGVLTGRTGRKLLAHLPGGDLELEWPADEPRSS